MIVVVAAVVVRLREVVDRAVPTREVAGELRTEEVVDRILPVDTVLVLLLGLDVLFGFAVPGFGGNSPRMNCGNFSNMSRSPILV